MSTGEDACVYEYDVVMDTWSVYDSVNQDFMQADNDDINNCIYMLNEVLSDQFAVEYYDAPEEVKQAIFLDETNSEVPDKLIGGLEEIPNGYYPDPLARSYYPVYNFDSYDSLIEHLNDYFTVNAMSKVKTKLEYQFSQIDGTLYLVRGGMGYGVESLDFDVVDTSRFEDEGIVIVDRLFFDKKDGEYRVQFAFEDSVLKIDSFE